MRNFIQYKPGCEDGKLQMKLLTFFKLKQMRRIFVLLPLCLCNVFCHGQNLIDNYLSGTVTYSPIATSTDGVNQPRDLDFKPNSNELWIVNKGTSSGGSMVIVYNTGKSGQTSQLRKDSHSSHFMIYPSAVAFGDDGRWAGVSEIQSTASATSTFMGPALWSSDTNIFARVFQNNWVNGKPLGSHLDMLHQSPFAMGIAHDSAGAYWVMDGYNGNICKYEFVADHGPGYEDHSQGKIWRYTDVPILRVANIPGHVVKDKSTGWLYFVDAGNKKLKRMNTATGTIVGTLPVPSTASESLLGYWNKTGATVEIIDSFPTGQPCGVDVYNGRLVVSDYANGNISVYDVSGTPTFLGVIATGQTGIMGIKIGNDGKIWFVNNTLNTVYRADPATLINNDASILNISAPLVENYETKFYNTKFDICGNTITPGVIVENSGSNTITSLTIKYVIDNGTVNSYSWTGSLAAGSTTSVTLPSLTVGAGNHKLSVYTSNPNGSTDNNAINDKKEGSFRIFDPVVTLPISEGFSTSAFPPSNWSYVAYNKNNPMSRIASVGGFGAGGGALKMDNFSGAEDITGQKDYLITPRINMSSAATGTKLSFSVAYAQYNSGSADQLDVSVSTDCGNTWTSLYNKSGSMLSTASATTSSFTPAASDWRKETISLDAYNGQPSVQIMFTAISNYGNNVYIDDIDIKNTTGVEDAFLNSGVSVYPNPTPGNISVILRGAKGAEISIYNMLGELVIEKKQAGGNEVNIDLSQCASGFYLVRIVSDNIEYRTKVCIVK